MGDQDTDNQLREIQREYLDFLDDEGGDDIYHSKVKTMIEDEKKRITVNVNDLRSKNQERSVELLNNAFEEQILFQKALHEYVSSIDTNYAVEHDEFLIAFEGSFGSKHVTPRTLTNRFLGNMVCLEGIATKCSTVFPKIVKSVHYCDATKRTMERRYTDLTSLDAFPSSSVYPTKDDDGNLLETEFGLSRYKDHQTLTVQEMPEKAPAGQLPRYTDVICDNDLVDKCKPGDRVQIIGTYRCLPGKKGNYTTGAFRTVLIANHVVQLDTSAAVLLTREDIQNCRRLSKRKNIIELLSKSMAPSIHGHAFVKRAILCMLLGGVEKILPNGTRLRGDINVLLVGDPSVAKSQLLRYVLCTAPRAIATTGRGSSGVGLTAAVTTDPETNERRLEAGAMVLADRGVVCIDEFDKMSDLDRTAIHEVMEQGRVTISKAGIHARLNARCSVLAAANPVYGRYDQYRTPLENINLQDSLLSRFDLLFVMLDTSDKEYDQKISEHVLRMHRYRKPGEQDGEILKIELSADMLSTQNLEELSGVEQTAPIFEKYDSLLHGENKARHDKILTTQFMRKYIHLAKSIKPVLTEDACEIIAKEYSKLRSQDMLELDVARTQPVTARTLETLIRLATAHAKARYSRFVSVEDAQNAISLVQFAYFKKVLEKPSKKKRKNDDLDSETYGRTDDDDDDEDDDNNTDDVNRPHKRSRTQQDSDPYAFPDSSDLDSQSVDLTVRVPDSQSRPDAGEVFELPPPTSISKERLNLFRAKVADIFKNENKSSLPLKRIVEITNRNLPSLEHPFEGGEIAAAIQKMSDSDNNQVMLANDMLFLV